jgi:hypothetical protein
MTDTNQIGHSPIFPQYTSASTVNLNIKII